MGFKRLSFIGFKIITSSATVNANDEGLGFSASAGRFFRRYGDNMNRTVRTKFHLAVAFGKKSKVVSSADKKTRTKFAAALADDNASGRNILTAENLYAQTLRVRIAPVCRTSLTFCMCHE